MIHSNALDAPDDFSLSPFTGYTRAHWLEIVHDLVAGVLPYIDRILRLYRGDGWFIDGWILQSEQTA